MAAADRPTDGANERLAAATAQATDGILVVVGIQSRTASLELAWRRTPQR
jgi:hypothetical protein